MNDNASPAKPARKPRKSTAKPAAAKSARPRKPVPTKTAETAGASASSSATAPPPIVLIRMPMPVRWRDLDAFNHVNNSKYLSYLEEARLQWMIGVPGQGLDDHVAPVVAAAHLNYRRPIAWPTQVVIELFVERLGNTSLTIGHRIVDAEDTGVLYCDGNVVMVWIDRDSGAAAALPAAVREDCG